MAYVVIEDFKAGLDRRRMRETSPPGTLYVADNVHITRGGEIEKRKAFAPKYTLPSGSTVGLASASGQLFVFGSETTPAGLPTGISYQRLQHPTGEKIQELLSYDVFDGKIYAAAEFADGSIFHFFDGTIVSDWFDGRARASFQVQNSVEQLAVAATGTISITGGIVGDTIDSISVGGINILGTAVPHTGDNSTTAANVAAQINSYISSPEYTATSLGNVITISADISAGSSPNGLAITGVTTGSASVGTGTSMLGGRYTSEVTSIVVNGVEILGASVAYTTSPENTAALIAAQINSYTSSPNYTASSNGATVNIIYPSSSATPNGYIVTIAKTVMDVDHVTTTLAGGVAPSGTLEPGTFVKTIKSKMHALSGSVMLFAAVNDPTKWNTGTGAGFTNMLNQDSASETLVALENYYTNVAIFSRRNVQIWYLDVDNASNQQLQVLHNTGAISSGSVKAFGDNDVFYLSQTGIRSLKARDASNSAYVNDVGTAIDSLITDAIRTLGYTTASLSKGVIDPVDGRYMLALGPTIYVFSFFPSSKISAWTTYTPGFDVGHFASVENKVYARSGDKIYLYGGDDGQTYDASRVEVQLPYLDGKKPDNFKYATALGMACEGVWEVDMATKITDPTVVTNKPVTVDGTTYGQMVIPLESYATAFALRFVNETEGYARIGNIALHYHDGETTA